MPDGELRTGGPDRRAIVKPIDAWWTVLFIDPVAVRMVPLLAAHPRITPTRITWLAHLLGVGSVTAFGLGELVVGALLFELRFLCDCLDGKLARFTGRTSTVGRELDVTGDLILVTANLAALGLAGVDGSQPRAVLVVTLVASYVLSMHLHGTRQRLLDEAGATAPVDDLLGRGVGRFLVSRRMYPMPTSVEVEHLLLFVAPLVTAFGPDVWLGAFLVGAAFYVVQAARYCVGILRAAARSDATPR